MKLHWKGRTFHKTIPLSPSTANVADIYLAPGYMGYDRFCQSQSVDPESLPADFPFVADPTVIPPDEDDEPIVRPAWNHGNFSDEWEPEQSSPRTFNLSGPPTVEEREQAPMVIIDEEDREENIDPPAAQLLRCHQRFGHISFTKLQEMAKKGIIPSRLAKCKTPFCSPCAYAKATKRPWRNRSKVNAIKPVPVTKPGQMVSVDQLVSPAPGLIGQMTGFIMTKQRHTCATVFIDHHSNLGFVLPAEVIIRG